MHRLAGDHVTLLDLPEVEQLAGMMLESLRKARASTPVAADQHRPRSVPGVLENECSQRQEGCGRSVRLPLTLGERDGT